MRIIDKINKVGFAKIIDDIVGNRFSYLNYLFCRQINKVYFGSYLGATQGKSIRHFYMKELVRHYCTNKNDTINILELGSWAGGSAITWAEAIKQYCPKNSKVLCIDPWTDYIDNFNNRGWIPAAMSKGFKNETIYKLFLHNIIASGNSDIISILRGSSDEILPFLKDEAFDLIFIDANHAYKYIRNDIKNFAPLIKNGGILCGDDLELQYNEVDHSTMIQMKEYDNTIDPLTNNRYHPGVSLAVYEYFVEDVSVWEGFWAMRKEGNCWKKIPLEIDQKEVIIPSHLR